jgi:hypothetical protein
MPDHAHTPWLHHMKHRWLIGALACLVLAFLAPVAHADDVAPEAVTDAAVWELVDEQWFALQMGTLGSGWMHQTTHQSEDRFRTTKIVSMSIARMGDAGEIRMESAFEETKAGKPLKMTGRQIMSAQPMENIWVFEPEHVVHTAKQGGRETTRQANLPQGTWLTPREATRFVRKRISAGAGEITYRTLDPESGLTPITITSKRHGEGTFRYNDKDVPVTIWKSTTSLMPVQSTEQFTADGEMVYQETPTGMGMMTLRRVSKDEALNLEIVADAEPMLPQTFITPSAPMEDVLRTRSATFKLRAKRGDIPELPSAGAQRVTRHDDGSVTIHVDLDNHLPATEDEISDAAYREASAMIDSDDAMIRALANRAIRDAKLTSSDDALARADAMRSFVHNYITNPNLDVPFASASETARTRSGDCTEFGVLLAAMLRADGIPSRVATGLVYADQFAGSDDIFGWHMWTQALIDGLWIDLDATLPVQYHAGHILTGTSSLHEGTGSAEMASIIVLIGNLEIDVLDVGH